MMKHKKYILGVLLLALLVGFGFYNIFNVEAAGTNPGKCTKEVVEELKAYYGVSVSNNGYSVSISSANGIFRIVDFGGTESLISNTLVKGTDGFYTVDGGLGEVSPNSTLVLNINTAAATEDFDVLQVRLVLSQDDGNTKCKAGQFETGFLEADVMSSSKLASIEAVYKYPNELLGLPICRELQAATDPAQRNFYYQMAPNCFDSEVEFYATNTEENVEAVTNMANTAKTVWEITSESVIDDGDGNEPWEIVFNRVRDAAKDPNRNHAYFGEAQKNAAGKFFNLLPGNKKGKTSINNQFSLKCNTKAEPNLSVLQMLKPDGSYNIDANVDYFYAVNKQKYDVTYTWKHTEGSGTADDKTETKHVCTRTCEEALEVKYGPPVASKAGLCFEYEIKVTSRIKCKSEVNTDAKPSRPKLCNPVPICNSIPGYTHQAGANEEYDDCIYSCDGGKYSNKCSEKCYKKVYGNNKNSKSSKTVMTENTTNAEKIMNRPLSYKGHYEWSGNKIVWPFKTYCRWYKENQAARTARDHGYNSSTGKTYFPDKGFKKRLYSSGFCKDPCHFVGCSKDRYLNLNELEKDYNKNNKLYQDTVKSCKAEATCQTNTAIVKIWVNYIDGAGQKQIIDFPYSKTRDESAVSKLNVHTDASNSQCTSNPSLANGKTILLNNNTRHGMRGCYLNCGRGTKYHLWWHIPGSWLNAKYGDISYTEQTSAGWTERVGSLCIPLDAKDVNQKWWNYYYSLYSANQSNLSINNIKDKDGTHCRIDTSSTDVTDWNIRGSAERFGYFGWNIDVSCFYALNKKYVKNTSEICKSTDLEGSTPYRIRSVDLNNLFPKSDGKQTSTSEYGRVSGYNWSEFATNNKNEKYKSSPKTYGIEVQKKGGAIYNEKNLEYQFKLTKADLNRLKSATDKNYTEFGGSMIQNHGIQTYQSNLFRGDSATLKASVLPNTGLLGCNNIIVENGSQRCEDSN